MAKIQTPQDNNIPVGGQVSINTAASTGLTEASLGQQLAGIQQAYFNEAKQADQTANYAKALSEATLEFQKKYQERLSQTTDKEGKPTYGSLLQDTGNIGKEVLKQISSNIVDPEVSAKFKQNFNLYVGNQQVGALSQARQQQMEFVRASVDESLNQFANSSIMASPEQAGYFNLQAEKIINDALSSGAISPEEKVRMLDNYKSNVSKTKLTMMIDKDPEGALTAIDEYGSQIGLQDYEKDIYKSKAEQEIMRRNQEMSTQIRKQEKVLDEQITSFEKVMFDGGEVPVQDLQNLANQVKGTPLEYKLQNFVKKQTVTKEFALLDPRNRTEVINSLRANNSTPELISFRKQLEAMDKELMVKEKEDPYQLAITQGTIDQPNPLNLQGDVSQQLRDRLDSVSKAEVRFGRPVPGLTKAEMADVVEKYENSTYQEKVKLLGQISQGLGSKSITVFNNIAKKGSTQLAYLGNLVQEDQVDVALAAVKGQDIIKANSKILPSHKEFSLDEQEMLPQYASAQQRADTITTARNIYASLSQAEGDYSGVLNSDRYQKALEMVTNGGSIEWDPNGIGTGSSKIEPPIKGMSQGEFEDWIDSVDDDDIRQLGGMYGMDSGMADTLKKSNLINVGRGKYMVLIPSSTNSSFGDNVKPAIRSDGKPFILDYESLKAGKEPANKKFNDKDSRYDSQDPKRLTENIISKFGGLSQASNQNTSDTLGRVAQAVSNVYGDNPVLKKVAMTQAILESGLLGRKSQLAAQHNNYFGIKGKGTSGTVKMLTTEFNGKSYYRSREPFAANATPEDSFMQHRQLMQNRRYNGVVNASSPEEAFLALQKAGYATDPNYAKKLNKIYATHVAPLFVET